MQKSNVLWGIGLVFTGIIAGVIGFFFGGKKKKSKKSTKAKSRRKHKKSKVSTTEVKAPVIKAGKGSKAPEVVPPAAVSA